ncbi:hypothetical protein DDB_G0292288 [Dictyostelium discoideum AX4]|uniref:SCP domain-containing protein n=1 Tax=Dictyostelium discoideum TaxID=44689 RepID=Q54DG5_DICDI|nr:hypothetical protein DDB_G0292288 [Dictyostelium discoideum AX4]EAL61268.1 hypothetical protein DDB_G0292288 [Dictyostelium discoideum AX4]|eukprot:XP_629676.1 hypothetical protein DDB_G0292288 [Dictyostelium discoideum AX4]
MRIIYNLVICIFISSLLMVNQVSAYGESEEGYPSHFERESHNLVNLVRMFPAQYKANYMNDYKSMGLENILNVPAVPPVWYNSTLNDLARFHSNDMATYPCFSHNSCDGTDIWKRFNSFITCSNAGSRSENIAAGYSSGIQTNNQLLCDKVGSICATDASDNDGHRVNIMSKSTSNLGVGHVYVKGSTYGSYWTQDFTSGSCSLPDTPIYSAYHTFPSGTKPQFIAIYYNQTMPADSIELVFVDGDSIDMTLTYGSSTAGAYMTTTDFNYCAQYYFDIKTESGETYRYPDTGFLQLVNNLNASCPSWVDSDSSASSNSISLIFLILLSLLVTLLI